MDEAFRHTSYKLPQTDQSQEISMDGLLATVLGAEEQCVNHQPE